MSFDPAMLAAAANLRLDALAVGVMTALEIRGVDAVLLKGPSTERWLYTDGTPRGYRDVDLLVSPEQEGAAARALEGLGFVAGRGIGRPDPGVAQDHEWLRGEERVDLHVTMVGIEAPPERLWALISRDTMEVAGAQLRVLDKPGRAMHIALHAAHHGGQPQPLEDLRRAIAQAADDVWRDAISLARQLDAAGSMRAGLELLPEGQDLIGRLEVTDAPPVTSALRAEGAPTPALGLERVAATPGTIPKIRRVLGSLFPTPDFMRWWIPLAEHGRVGLGLSYVYRPFWLLRHLVPSIKAWRRARRRSRGG